MSSPDLPTAARSALASMEAVLPLLREIQLNFAPHGDHDELIARYVVNRDALAEALKENGMAKCDDCGRPYGDEHGFPDLIIEKDAWQAISPTGDDGGLLCPSCICKRLHDAGIKTTGAFMSGPVESVSRPVMLNTRWIENLRVQGHGWRCPECSEYRERKENGDG